MFSLDWDFYQCTLVDRDEDGYYGLQIDQYGEEGGHPVDMRHYYGFLGLPQDPTGETGAEQCATIVAKNGGEDHVWPLEDPRVMARLPRLEQGETMHYAANGHFVRLKKDGTIALSTSTEEGKPEGETVALQISPKALTFVAPWGKLVFDPTGFHVVTGAGARIDLGGMSGGPLGLMEAFSSYARVKAASVTLDATIASAKDPVVDAKLNAIMAYLRTVQAALLGAMAAQPATTSMEIAAVPLITVITGIYTQLEASFASDAVR